VGHSQRCRPFPFARRLLAQHAIGTQGLLPSGPCFPRPAQPAMNWQPLSTHRGASQHYRGSPHVNATAKTPAGEFGLARSASWTRRIPFPSRLPGCEKSASPFAPTPATIPEVMLFDAANSALDPGTRGGPGGHPPHRGNILSGRVAHERVESRWRSSRRDRPLPGQATCGPAP
jgi:hypothetical protein